MNREDHDIAQATFDGLTTALQAVAGVLRALPKVPPGPLVQLEVALKDLASLPRLQVSAHAKSWEARRAQLLPYLAEYADEPPRQLDYEDLSQLLGLSVTTIRMRISQSPYKGFVRLVRGRPVVVARDPANLTRLLDEKFARTQHPDDQVILPKRPPKAR